MDLERERQRQTYQLCRLGFAILSLALLLACFSSLLYLTPFFVGRGPVVWFRQMSWSRWIDAPIVWGSLVGTYLLWGRWSEPGWQRRAGLLVLMGLVDAVLWFLEHGADLGLRLSEVGHEWLRVELGEALGWAEFALIASLAGDLMSHLGVEQAPTASKATRSLATKGAIVWMLFFCQQTDWNAWPLKNHGISSVEAWLLLLVSNMIWSITLIQVTALSIAAVRQTTRVLAEMDQEDREHDLLKSPSESHLNLIATHRHGDPGGGMDEPSW
ncbi:MAG: hypothetical protein JOZ63_18425 [Planctomycetaceae bacterium]|nr:hypothetical protein [Planctomycetaceae bacterium]MBV8384565.1 hypothetical protein [Planctomycetaceae bacterium]